MSRKRFTQEQITFALRQAESGLPVEDVCQKLGFGQATFFRWKTKYGAMGNEEIRRLRILEKENRNLKQLVVVLSSLISNFKSTMILGAILC